MIFILALYQPESDINCSSLLTLLAGTVVTVLFYFQDYLTETILLAWSRFYYCKMYIYFSSNLLVSYYQWTMKW
jgi:hypothetical protein